jgi:hypothetical protein
MRELLMAVLPAYPVEMEILRVLRILRMTIILLLKYYLS